MSKNHISGADGDGLQASWRTLQVFPDDYVTTRGFLSLRCRATVPTRPPNVRSMSVRLFVAARPHISSYMFSKNSKFYYCFLIYISFCLKTHFIIIDIVCETWNYLTFYFNTNHSVYNAVTKSILPLYKKVTVGKLIIDSENALR